MPIRIDAVGQTRSTETEITARDALAYAAVLGFDSEACLDDARPGGLVVVPMLCTRLEWILVGDDQRAASLGLTLQERRRGVHAFQDSQFYHPLRVGMKVRSTSRNEYIRETSAGTLVLTSFEHREVQTGDLLIKSWSGTMLRGIGLGQPSAGISPSDFIEAGPAAAAAESREVFLPWTLPHVYSECADIWNPIHTERAVALAAGLPDIIVHGTITWAISAREALKVAGKEPLALRRLSARFRNVVLPGTPITVKLGAFDADGNVSFSTLNAEGEPALANGLVTIDGASGAR
jgi:acyl dehydratase